MPNPFFESLRGLGILTWHKLAHQPQPRYSGTLRLPGLTEPVEVLFDRWGVPHIYSPSIHSALTAQGFIHAQERLFQMDFNRRLVAGQLCEILGAVALPADRWMRTLGLRRAAVAQDALLKNENRELLQAYCAGVNAYIQTQPLPLECRLLDYTPAPWTPLDTLAWTRMMAWTLSVNWETELLRAALVARLGPEQAARLEPEVDGRTIVPPGVDYSVLDVGGVLKRVVEARGAATSTGLEPRPGIGSNNWVLHSDRTTTGAPLLANDMHLGLTIPAIWYENHLTAGDPTSPELEIAGVSFPGIPMIIAGHNRYLAWGFTNGFPDVQDLYIEHLRRLANGSVEYEFVGEWLPAEVLKEEIHIKNGSPVIEEVILTHHGPIVNSLAPDLCGESPLALRWTALEGDEMMLALLNMNQARDVDGFRQSLRYWSVPIQNIVYADVNGVIAYSFPGKVPIRAKGDGRLPVPGWTGEYEWTGYIPFEQLPHQHNPAQGFIATANNRVVGKDYPYWLGYDHVSSHRAERIVEMIEAKERLSVADIQKMHVDQISTAARPIAMHLRQLTSSDPDLVPILALFKEWDASLGASSPAAAVYEVFVIRLLYRLINPLLGDLAERYAGKGPNPILMKNSLYGERAREWLASVLADPSSTIFDQEKGGTRHDHMLAALRESMAFLKEKLGPDMQGWEWGELHQLTLHHFLGVRPPLDSLFNRGPYPLGGDYDTVWASGSSSFDLNNDLTVGPPYRFIADLSNWNNCQSVLLPGQSGQPASQHYTDQIDAWYAGQYHPMPFDRSHVEGATSQRLTLVP